MSSFLHYYYAADLTFRSLTDDPATISTMQHLGTHPDIMNQVAQNADFKVVLDKVAQKVSIWKTMTPGGVSPESRRFVVCLWDDAGTRESVAMAAYLWHCLITAFGIGRWHNLCDSVWQRDTCGGLCDKCHGGTSDQMGQRPKVAEAVAFFSDRLQAHSG